MRHPAPAGDSISARPNELVALGAVRTPLGGFGGSLRDLPSWELGAVAIRAALERSGVEAGAVDEVIGASCRQAGNGLNPTRTAALLAGVPPEVPAQTLNMACPSGMKTIQLAQMSARCGEGTIWLACAMDSMSRIPHLVRDLRFSKKRLGDLVIEDGWNDSRDPISSLGMGETADRLAARRGISREEQDRWALISESRAAAADREGLFGDELAAVSLPARENRPAVELLADEAFHPDTSAEKLAALRPAFSEDGTVTAGNSSSLADGAAAMLLTTRAHADRLGIDPLFSVTAFAQTAVDGAEMGLGPSRSIPLVLERAGMRLDEIDLIEVNEAFAAQLLAGEQDLGWDPERVNVHGGAIALGHPTGVSGLRIVVTLAHALRARGGEFGLAALCGGGGVTTALTIRRES
jgi:acetyl-CoA C-acetyltransferase